MILVAGGTGTLGRVLVARLTESGNDVRVLTRDADRARGLSVEVAVGDVRDASSLTTATSGATVVISAVHGFLGGRGSGPHEVDEMGNGNLVRAALAAEVPHFVLLSALDARSDHAMSLHRAKYAAEQQLRSSGLPWTILRPSPYIETWTEVIGAKLATGGPAIVFGRADNPINFVSVADVARLAERAIGDPALRGRIIDVPGPDNLTMMELAHRLGANKVKRVPRVALRVASTVLAPVAPGFARQARAAVIMDTTDMTADGCTRTAGDAGVSGS